MLYHRDVDGDCECVHIFDEDKLKVCLKALADMTNEIYDLPTQDGVKQKVLGCVNPAQENKLTIPGISPVVTFRRTLDLQLSRHEHDMNVLNTYMSTHGSRFQRILPPAPNVLFSSEMGQPQSSFKAQDTVSFLTSDLLYRKMMFAEYTYLCNRKELPCNDNYFSPDSLWQYSPDGPTGLSQNHEVLVEFTLTHSLDSILDNVLSSNIPVYREGGNLPKATSENIDMFARHSYAFPKKGKTEFKAGMRIKSDCISFRMNNGLKTDVCYIPLIQGELENVEVEAYNIVISDEKYDALQKGNREPMRIKFHKVADYYLPLLKSNFTFNSR